MASLKQDKKKKMVVKEDGMTRSSRFELHTIIVIKGGG